MLLLAACGHGGETLPPRTMAESSGEPAVARKAARARLGRFERALARRDVERVRVFFSDTLLAHQSAAETRTLVSQVRVDHGAPDWLQVCLPNADCGRTRFSAGWMLRDADAIAAIETDEAGRVTTFQSYPYQCRAHTGCWSVYLPEQDGHGGPARGSSKTRPPIR